VLIMPGDDLLMATATLRPKSTRHRLVVSAAAIPNSAEAYGAPSADRALRHALHYCNAGAVTTTKRER
jgi:hypothetical protein